MTEYKHDNKYTWLPFFGKMLNVICENYNKESLKEIFHKIGFNAYKTNKYIDPLTFIAYFNIGGDEARKTYCKNARDLMKLEVDVPNDFTGIPRFDPRNPVFFKEYTNILARQ